MMGLFVFFGCFFGCLYWIGFVEIMHILLVMSSKQRGSVMVRGWGVRRRRERVNGKGSRVKDARGRIISGYAIWITRKMGKLQHFYRQEIMFLRNRFNIIGRLFSKKNSNKKILKTSPWELSGPINIASDRVLLAEHNAPRFSIVFL